MKVVKVVPIYKAGDINNFETYRLISLSTVISEVTETAFHIRMVSYIYRFNLLSSNQLGFRQKTIDALAFVTEQIRDYFDFKMASPRVFLDLKKRVAHYQSWWPFEKTQWLWLQRSDIDHSQMLPRLYETISTD